MTIKEQNARLARARETQTAYWNALYDLEDAIGVDVDCTIDLQHYSVQDLKTVERKTRAKRAK